MLTNGQYLARVTGCGLGFAGTGTPQVAVSFDVEAPDGSAVPMTWYGFFTDAAEPITIKALRVLGFDAENGLLTDLVTDNPQDCPIFGAKCKVKIAAEADPQTGVMRAKIQFVNPESGVAMANPMEGASLNAFAVLVQARAKARRAASGRPPSPVGQRPASPAPGSNVGKPTPAALGDFDPPF